MTTVFLQIFLPPSVGFSPCRPILRFFPLPVVSSAIHFMALRRKGWLCLVETMFPSCSGLLFHNTSSAQRGEVPSSDFSCSAEGRSL